MSLAYCEGFVAEGYTDGDERWNLAQPYQLEAKDTWYSKHFHNRDHQNYVIAESVVGPVAVSLTSDAQFYRLIVRSVKDGTECFKITRADVKPNGRIRRMLRKPPTSKEIVCFCKPELKRTRLLRVTALDIQDRLQHLEEPQFDRKYRIGVVYSTPEQTTENEMYSNVEGSPYWTEFLEFLGTRVRLKGWDKYDGGLDTKNDMTGTESIFTDWNGAEIMWHVSTMLPYLPADPKQLARKKHIGNDRCVIIFRDGDSPPVRPSLIASKQLHILAVVQRHVVPGDDRTYYKFAVATRDSVPPYEPDMPNPPIFRHSEEFRDFLLGKLLNGVVSTRYAAEFSLLMKGLYDTRLKEIVRDYQ